MADRHSTDPASDAAYQARRQAADILRSLRWTRNGADYSAATWMLTGITVLLIRLGEHDAAEDVSKARTSIPCVRTTDDDVWVDRLSQLARELENGTIPVPMGLGVERPAMH